MGLVDADEREMHGSGCEAAHLRSRAGSAAFEEPPSDFWLLKNATTEKNFSLQASSGGVLALRSQLPA